MQTQLYCPGKEREIIGLGRELKKRSQDGLVPALVEPTAAIQRQPYPIKPNYWHWGTAVGS